MDCERFLAALPRYLDDALEPVEREALRGHLATCPGCRRRALAVEPSLALVAAPPPEAAPEDVERCVVAVTSMIRQDRLSRRLRPPRGRVLAAAAALVIAIGAGAMWRVIGSGPAATATSGVSSAVAESPAPRAPEVEVDMPEAGVRVYHLAVDEGSDTAVALVVNPALEL